ncbi:MAG TPA: penicillin-binding protein 2 [Candidatus Paceibacterota bacterium]
MKWNFDSRIRLISVFFIAGALLTVTRLYFLQIVHSENYQTKAEGDLLSQSEKLFDRGAIYFKNKNGSLTAAAEVETGYMLSINPKLIAEPEKIYENLSKFIEIDQRIFLEKANKTEDQYEEILKNIDAETGEKIRKLKLPGVIILKDQWRVYPADALAAHVLGFVGYNGNVIDGRYGLERYYEDNLGRDSNVSGKNFFVEIFSNAKKIGGGGDRLEADIISSIEPSIERNLEDEIKIINDKWSSKSSGGIIMDPKTGEIYAMTAYPSFNPNSYKTEKDVSIFSNPLVERVYEMGSILKPITMAIGLDTRAVTATTTYRDEGFLKIDDRTIYNFDKKGRGLVSMQEVLNQSLNTGVATVALKIGKKTFTDYIQKFGLGEETGIDLPSEAGGLIQNLLKSFGKVELANASFGQGIAVTPIEMIRALSVLGNGGLLPNPHIVKELNYELGFSKKIIITEEEMRRVIAPETSEEITRMLVEVVDKALKNGAAKFEHYSVAAKTGTAQIANPGGGGYYPDKYLHSFFGYFPAYKPRFIIFLYTIEPNAPYASETLTDSFINIVKFLINYYQIPPDR